MSPRQGRATGPGSLGAVGVRREALLADVDADHGLPEIDGNLGDHLGVVVVRDGLHDGPGALGRVPRLENARPHEHPVHPQLHHEGGVRRRRHTPRREVDHGQPPQRLGLTHELHRGADLLGVDVQLVLVHGLQHPDGPEDGPAVPHRLDHVARARLALGADHRRALRNAAQGLAQVAAPAHERNLEVVLVDVVHLVSRSQHLGLIDVVHPRASRICASTKCPMRALAMTGMVTACLMARMMLGSDMRATPPPCFRMSAGTRSSAITATAPASSAILASSTLVTSMMTPPLSICASPALVAKVPVCGADISAPPVRYSACSASNVPSRRRERASKEQTSAGSRATSSETAVSRPRSSQTGLLARGPPRPGREFAVSSASCAARSPAPRGPRLLGSLPRAERAAEAGMAGHLAAVHSAAASLCAGASTVSLGPTRAHLPLCPKRSGLDRPRLRALASGVDQRGLAVPKYDDHRFCGGDLRGGEIIAVDSATGEWQFNFPVEPAALLGLRGRRGYLDPEIVKAYEDMVAYRPREGYSEEAMKSREHLLAQARDALRRPGSLGRSAASTTVSWAHLPGGLALLVDAREYDLVIEIGNRVLRTGRAGSAEPDVVLAIALAHCALARDALDQGGRVGLGVARLEEALSVLRAARPPLAPGLQREVEAALERLLPHSHVEQLGAPINAETLAARKQALMFIAGALSRGKAAEEGVTDRALRIAMSKMTAEEVVSLVDWAEVAASPSSVPWIYHGIFARVVQALIVTGFSRRSPEHINQAKELARSPPDGSTLELERCVCYILLGDVDRAFAILTTEERRRSQRSAQSLGSASRPGLVAPTSVMRYIRSVSSPDDLLPGLCMWCEDWLVVTGERFRGSEGLDPSLTAYFEDPQMARVLAELSHSKPLRTLWDSLSDAQAALRRVMDKVSGQRGGRASGAGQPRDVELARRAAIAARDNGGDARNPDSLLSHAMGSLQREAEGGGGPDAADAGPATASAHASPGGSTGSAAKDRLEGLLTRSRSVAEGASPRVPRLRLRPVHFLLPAAALVTLTVPLLGRRPWSLGPLRSVSFTLPAAWRSSDTQRAQVRSDIEAAIRSWQRIKHGIMEGSLSAKELPTVLGGDYLSSWRLKHAQAGHDASCTWRYELRRLDVTSIRQQPDGRVEADVTINEKATLHLANGTVADTYDGPYRMTYQLERGGDGCWRIVAGHVRFGSY